ncbi:MAG: hypothetical protein WDW36_001091 [Sanguina aurantia]
MIQQLACGVPGIGGLLPLARQRAHSPLAGRQRSSLGVRNTERVAERGEQQGHGEEVFGATAGIVATAAVAPTPA